ncbi:MAG TPA: PAS domain S-box protein [Kiritimatiellia bacterium]|nr:PAS domain S-box protein [Kiritimatiellia bacterium]
MRDLINVVIRWNKKTRRFGWIGPVLLAMFLTMAAVAAFEVLHDMLRIHLSFTQAYIIPLAGIGMIAGVAAFIVLHIYHKMAQETVEEVNERLRVSGELTNERTLMRALMENTPDHIYFKDHRGRFLRINHAMAHALGLKDPAEAVGLSEMDYFSPAVAEEKLQEEARVRESGQPILAKEEHIIWPDGKDTWVSITKLPLVDRQGRIKGTFGISRDITHSKLAELQIRQLFQAVEQSPSIVLITDKNGDITYVNPKFTIVTGYAPDEVIGKNPRLLKGGDVPESVYRDMWATITVGGEWSGEILNRKKNGETYWGLASISPIRNTTGVITHYLEVMEDVTQRKLTEQALHRQFAFQRQLIDAMPMPIFHKDKLGYYQECNEAFAQFLGYPREDIIGHTVFDLAPPDLAERYHQQDMALIRSAGLQQYEGAVLHSDGTRHQVMFSKALVHDDKGDVTGIVGAMVDLTDLKQAQAALQIENRRREELEKIVSKSPAMVFLWRAEPGWPVEYVSDNVRQLGYSPDDFTAGGMPFSQIVHPDDLPMVAAQVTEYSRSGANEFEQQYRVFSKRGELRWIDDRTWVRRGVGGEITHYQGVVMDITDRKIAEQRQEATMTGLRSVLEMADSLLAAANLEDLYRRAVELSREKLNLERSAIMIVRDDSIVGTFGTNLKGQTARETDHVIHIDDKWRERLNPRKPGEKPWMIVSEPYFEWDGQTMVGFGRGWVALTPIMSHQHGAIGLFCNDCAISGAPVDEVKQEILAVFCALLGNIIARKKAEEEQHLIQAQHRDFMERTDRLNSLGMLAAGMAHEINNPLQGMLSHLHSVHRALKADENARKSLIMVERGIDTIATLVRKLLIFGRSSEQEGESVECREAIEFVTQLLASQFKRSKVTIETDVRAPFMMVAMPRRYLVQVLLNLLINARDAMPDGGVIKVQAVEEHNESVIQITDSGCGIPSDQLSQIFKPFHTTKGAKGTGLGLSVADSLVRSSHGVIHVESKPGKTTFSLRIPLKKRDA